MALAFLLSMTLAACSSDDDDRPSDDAASGNVAPGLPVALGGVAIEEPELAVELTWQPASDADGVVVGYELRREGAVLASAIDALEYRDSDVEPAETYRYAVRAIDDDGALGEPGLIELAMPAREPILNVNNHQDVLGYVLGVFAGRGYDAALFAGVDFVAANEPVSVELLDPKNSDATRSLYNCPDGGSASVITFSSAAGAGRSIEQRYETCGWNGRTRDGVVKYRLEPYSHSNWTYEGYSSRDALERSVSVEGSVRSQSMSCKVFDYDFWSAAVERYESAEADESTTLTDIDTRFGYGDDCGQSSAVLSGSFSVRSPETGGQLLSVDTPVEFVNASDESREFAVGRLDIRADDGSSLVLDTDDGDDDSATIAVTLTTDDASETQSYRWERWLDRLSFPEVSE